MWLQTVLKTFGVCYSGFLCVCRFRKLYCALIIKPWWFNLKCYVIQSECVDGWVESVCYEHFTKGSVFVVGKVGVAYRPHPLPPTKPRLHPPLQATRYAFAVIIFDVSIITDFNSNSNSWLITVKWRK